MRRGVGLAGIDRQKDTLKSYATLSESLNQESLQTLETQLTQFRTALMRFAQNHREDIKKDPSFRAKFQQMCAAIGVDPLAGPKRGGSWWAELFGFLGDWQFELGVQIVDVCVNTRERNGGLIEMEELIRLLSKLRGIDSGTAVSSTSSSDSRRITEEDIVKSIQTLSPLGAGYQIVEIGSRKMVRSVMKELDSDQAVLLETASKNGGIVWPEMVASSTGWTLERSRTALENMLMRDGLCWLDEQDRRSTAVYWVTAVLRWD